MSWKRFSAEQISPKLREAEVETSPMESRRRQRPKRSSEKAGIAAYALNQSSIHAFTC